MRDRKSEVERAFEVFKVILRNNEAKSELVVRSEKKASAQYYEENFHTFLHFYGQLVAKDDKDDNFTEKLLERLSKVYDQQSEPRKKYYSREIAEKILNQIKEEYPGYIKHLEETIASNQTKKNTPPALDSWTKKAPEKSSDKENIPKAVVKDFEILLRYQAIAGKESAKDIDKDIYSRHLAAFAKQHGDYLRLKGFDDLSKRVIGAIPKEISGKTVDFRLGPALATTIETVKNDYNALESSNAALADLAKVVHLQAKAAKEGSTGQEKNAYATALQNFTIEHGTYIKKNGFDDLTKKVKESIPGNVNSMQAVALERNITKAIDAVKKDYRGPIGPTADSMISAIKK